MRTALRKMGNSTGMIVPKALLTEMGASAGTAIELRVENGRLVGDPVRTLREGWAEDAVRVAALPVSEEEADWMGFGNDGDDELRW
ncbi:hypothetical protein [uncultured Sphingomonas sp.]|uniref:AbrB/MazE/SpoVT family DNA-binding domain-containing protein n=1 Tax=uncultured Sphingomonas sp. TaxID=158754 RepID=UPI0025CD5791|nr:hypothetical protein [uncultured Sphingomonas sp.]